MVYHVNLRLCVRAATIPFEIFLVSESVFRFYERMFETRSLKPLLQVLNSPRLIDSKGYITLS